MPIHATGTPFATPLETYASFLVPRCGAWFFQLKWGRFRVFAGQSGGSFRGDLSSCARGSRSPSAYPQRRGPVCLPSATGDSGQRDALAMTRFVVTNDAGNAAVCRCLDQRGHASRSYPRRVEIDINGFGGRMIRSLSTFRRWFLA